MNLCETQEVSNAEDVAAVNQLYESGQQHSPAMDSIEVSRGVRPRREHVYHPEGPR